jgi:glycine cleavage system H protein
MESSSYVDIFATKGIEYLFIVAFLLSLIFFWRYLNSSKKLAPAISGQREMPPDPWFSLEKGLFYHQGHSWVRAADNDLAVVGIDDFAQRLLGRSSAIDLPQIGTRIQQGEKGWKLRFGSKAIDILSPIEGEVVAVNDEVVQNPALLNTDPYGSGWLMNVKVPQMKKDLTNLLSGDLAMAWMRETVGSIHKRMAGNLGLALQDGGTPMDGIAKILSSDNWDEVARDFLLTR